MASHEAGHGDAIRRSFRTFKGSIVSPLRRILEDLPRSLRVGGAFLRVGSRRPYECPLRAMRRGPAGARATGRIRGERARNPPEDALRREDRPARRPLTIPP